MALPPYVIEHGTAKDAKGAPLMLGPGGWTPSREGALSFPSEQLGVDWLIDARKQTPRLFQGHVPVITMRKHSDREQPADMEADARRPRLTSDFDPLGAA